MLQPEGEEPWDREVLAAAESVWERRDGLRPSEGWKLAHDLSDALAGPEDAAPDKAIHMLKEAFAMAESGEVDSLASLAARAGAWMIRAQGAAIRHRR